MNLKNTIEPAVIKKIIIPVVSVLIIATGIGFLIFRPEKFQLSTITTFEQCVQAGYPIAEKYPRECRTPDGKLFIEEIKDLAAEQTIGTRVGSLILEYRNGFATLRGTLFRPTPCVDWQIEIGGKSDFSPSLVTFNIYDKNKGQVCIQIIGQPQSITAKTPASPETTYEVLLEDEVVFSGKLQPALPAPVPTSNNLECKLDSDCPSANYTCEAIEGYGESYPEDNIQPPNFVITRGVCKLKAGNKCGSDEECAAGLVCQNNLCISTISQKCSGPGDKSCPAGYECIPACGPPVLEDPRFPPPGYICHLKGRPQLCPICLAENTLINTLFGQIPVQNIKIGMPIWTLNKAGDRVFGFVIKISKVPAPPSHQMVQLVLDDGRELFVSPGHPTIDGRRVGDLSPGDIYDGAFVKSAKLVFYNQSVTYDVLPSGETGFYWANGILLGSTLH
jgi:hypothetical protein